MEILSAWWINTISEQHTGAKKKTLMALDNSIPMYAIDISGSRKNKKLVHNVRVCTKVCVGIYLPR